MCHKKLLMIMMIHVVLHHIALYMACEVSITNFFPHIKKKIVQICDHKNFKKEKKMAQIFFS